MSREKIEEMANDIEVIGNGSDHIDFYRTAEILYRKGYRKQEWISVDERLPEGKAPIIVTDGEKVIVAYRNWLYRSNSTGKLRCPANYRNGMVVTHWMPLPEAPKMKGGAE